MHTLAATCREARAGLNSPPAPAGDRENPVPIGATEMGILALGFGEFGGSGGRREGGCRRSLQSGAEEEERAGRSRTAAETVAGDSERKLPRRSLGERRGECSDKAAANGLHDNGRGCGTRES